MGVRYSSDRIDVIGSNVVVAAYTMTSGLEEAAGEISVIIGGDLLELDRRFQVGRALQQLIDVSREAQWPVGANETNYAYLLTAPAVKGAVVVGNATEFPDATLSEESIIITYGDTDAGQSVKMASAFGFIADFVREQLSSVEGTGVATFADGVLTGTTIAADDTVTINSVVYTFLAAPLVANDIDVGADDEESLDNLIAAINAAAGEGTAYGTGTVIHPDVRAVAGAGDTMDVVARLPGTVGNAITTTASLTAGDFGAATLTGGANSTVNAHASGVLTGTTIAADDTVTINSKVYTFLAAPLVADDIDVGADDEESLDNLIAAIMGAAGEGTKYGTGTVAHTDVRAVAGAGDTMDVIAREPGTAGNAITTTAVLTAGDFAAATLLGGL